MTLIFLLFKMMSHQKKQITKTGAKMEKIKNKIKNLSIEFKMEMAVKMAISDAIEKAQENKNDSVELKASKLKDFLKTSIFQKNVYQYLEILNSN